MIRAIIYGLSVYIVLMLIVSSISTLVSPNHEEPERTYVATIGELEEEEVQTEHAETTKLEVEQTETTSYQKELLFDFSVNIIEEQTEQKQNIAFSFLFADIPHYDVYEELEKRKCKFIYQRKFALCIIKNRIKILKLKKWKIKYFI